jgi:hypothetical protein
MMKMKLFTRSDTNNRPNSASAERLNFVDLPNTRAWYPTISPVDQPTSHSRRLLGTARYATLAAFVVAGGAAMLATYQRSMNRDA